MQNISCLVFCCILLAGAQQSWIAKTSMPTKRSDIAAVALDDKILVSGGCDKSQECPENLDFCVCSSVSSRNEAYKPQTDEWYVLAEMPQARFRHAAAVVANKMYLLGGRDVNDTLIVKVDVYDYANDRWETLPTSSDWLGATSDLVAVALGSSIFAIGGYAGDYSTPGSVSVFDVNTLSWKSGHIPSMNVGRGDACGLAIDKLIYVVGGFAGVNFCAPLNSLEVYDSVSNTWTTKASLDEPRGDAACGYLHGELHVIGGEQKDNVSGCSKYDIPVKHVEHYHPSTDSWTEELPVPDARFRFAGVSYGNTVYVFGGQASRNPTTQTYPVVDSVIAWEDNTADNSTASVVSLAWFVLAVLFGSMW